MSDHPEPQIATDVSAAVLYGSPAALAVGAVVTAVTESLGLREIAGAFFRTAIYLVIPAILSVAVLTGAAVALEALRIKMPRLARWGGFVGLFLVAAVSLQLASVVLGLQGFLPFAMSGALLLTWIGGRFLGEFSRLDRPEAWLPGLALGTLVTVWVEHTFELRHSIVSDFMDPNAVLLAACAGLTIAAGFALSGIIAPERAEDGRLAWTRAVVCALAAVALAWGNRVVVVPRLYLEAHIAIAFFEWFLWVGACGWALMRADRGRSSKRIAFTWLSLAGMAVGAVVLPQGEGVRPRRLDYAAQGFAMSLLWADTDGDGFLVERLGGVDCSESDASIHPFARERGEDENCTGAVDDSPPPSDDGNSEGGDEELQTAKLTFLVTIDTVRPDFMSVYGSELDTTPELAAIEDWAVFERAYTSGGITTLAVASMLTGRVPLANDLSPVYRTVDRRYVFPEELRPGVRVNRVFTVPRDNPHPTIGDVFSGGGRSTFAFVDDGASRVFQKGLGYERGFDEFTFPNAPEGPGEEAWNRETLTDAVVDAVPELPDGSFVWLHYYDPHNAQGPCRQFEGMPRIGCYPDAIWDVDAALGRIIAALKKDERWEETLLVVTSDHGEGLGEHGLHHHGLDSYEEFVRIPMLVRGPGVKPGRFEMPVSLVDVAPTVVSAAGLQSPRSFQGHDLRQLQRGRKRRLPVLSQMLITSVDGRPYRQQTLVVDGDLRHMWDRVTHRSWTFDIGDDPAQRQPKDGEAATVVKRWIDVFEAREPDARPVVFPTTPLRR